MIGFIDHGCGTARSLFPHRMDDRVTQCVYSKALAKQMHSVSGAVVHKTKTIFNAGYAAIHKMKTGGARCPKCLHDMRFLQRCSPSIKRDSPNISRRSASSTHALFPLSMKTRRALTRYCKGAMASKVTRLPTSMTLSTNPRLQPVCLPLSPSARSSL